MVTVGCPYKMMRKADSKTVFVTCRNCSLGSSTIFDDHCRRQLFHILQKEHGVTRLVLNHAIVKVFSGDQLSLLKGLTTFMDAVDSYAKLRFPQEDYDACAECAGERKKQFAVIKEKTDTDPVQAYFDLKKLHETTSPASSECTTCTERFSSMLSEMLSKGELHRWLPDKRVESNVFYTSYIRPYVRPGFIDSYIQLEPPPDAVFLESYEVSRKGHRPMTVSLYMLRTRPEKMYFVVPPEYDLPRDELQLLEKVREHLSRHRPKDASFMDAETAREYFQHFGRQVLTSLVTSKGMKISGSRIEYLADIFARYTAGFGILEDLLLDDRIQDVYVNAPVTDNPLHIVLDGEEYTSNIYLSDGDIDALSSRFRTLSGRAFSEAAPVLDMDLQNFRTRVAAISNPLTPKGVAFALRRHRPRPWTLVHFVANKMLSPAAAGFLSFLVDGQASLLIAGSRGAGKTSLLSSLILEIPQRFRILTIEDTAEIPVDDLQHHNFKIQSLITKSIASRAASAEIDPTDALRTALRLGESVLILGEVRGVEAKVLFEAMRVGAAGNLIMGTIHGSTTRDVYERIVYDLGVPPTSFKAVDAVVITAPIREEGGIERKRRVTQISEITKTGWTTDPDPDTVFQDIMRYDTAKDTLHATDVLNKQQSQVLGSIAKKWGISVEKALENIRLRAFIKQTMAEHSTKHPELLEAAAVLDANNALWMFIEQSKLRNKHVNYADVQKKWTNWFDTYMSRMQ